MHVSHGLRTGSIPRTARAAGTSINGDRGRRKPSRPLATPEGHPSVGSVPGGYSYLKDVFEASPAPPQEPHYAIAAPAPHRQG